MQESITQPLSAPTGNYSPWQGLLDVFINPSRLGKALTVKPHWLIPAILTSLLYFLTFYLIKDLVIELSIQQMEEQAAKGLPTATEEQIRSMTGVFGLVGASLAGIVLPLIVSLVMMIVGSWGMGIKCSFERIYSSATYAAWLYAFGTLLLVPLMLMKGEMGFSVSPAALLSEMDVTSPLWVFLSKFSLFHIWEAIALSLMATEIFQTSRNKGYMIGIISLGLITSIGIGFSLLGALMQPS